MDFITLEDVNDEIVECTQDDIAEANSYLLIVSQRLNVKEDRIVTPAAYTVKRLGVVYALYIACVRSVGKDNLTSLDTESTRNDIYAEKARFYREEWKLLEKSITAADFTGGNNGSGLGGVCSIPVWRA